jgi:hypothetical protein
MPVCAMCVRHSEEPHSVRRADSGPLNRAVSRFNISDQTAGQLRDCVLGKRHVVGRRTEPIALGEGKADPVACDFCVTRWCSAVLCGAQCNGRHAVSY